VHPAASVDAGSERATGRDWVDRQPLRVVGGVIGGEHIAAQARRKARTIADIPGAAGRASMPRQISVAVARLVWLCADVGLVRDRTRGRS